MYVTEIADIVSKRTCGRNFYFLKLSALKDLSKVNWVSLIFDYGTSKRVVKRRLRLVILKPSSVVYNGVCNATLQDISRIYLLSVYTGAYQLF